MPTRPPVHRPNGSTARTRARIPTLKPRIPTFDSRRVKPPPKVADNIYSTPEYAAWRAAVIARAGNRCQDPNCKARHWPGQRLFADHIVELRDGGAAFDVRNGRALCGSAHTRKTAEARAARMRA